MEERELNEEKTEEGITEGTQQQRRKEEEMRMTECMMRNEEVTKDRRV